MREEKHKNTHQRDNQNLFEALNIWLKRGKIGIKKWNFRGKMQIIGGEKNVSRNETRKAKWCKMQILFLKMD